MTRIGGGGRTPGDDVGRAAGEPLAPDLRKQGAQKLRNPPSSADLPATVADAFERVAPQLEKRLQAMSGNAIGGRIHFGSEGLAQLAGAFASVLQQHPRAGRKERAGLFAKAVLQHRRIGKLLASASEQDLEDLFEALAAQLDGSPAFAQLVDEVTEGARKIGTR